MASPVAEIKFRDEDFRKLTGKLQKKAEQAVKKTALLVERTAVKLAPYKTQNLLNSITTEFKGSGFYSSAKVKATARYAIFVHEGTGIFGPNREPIRPKEKKALYWEGAAHPVKMVRGMKPRPFLRKALEEEGPKLYQLVFGR